MSCINENLTKHIRIIANNRSDLATLTALPAMHASYPVENVKIIDRELVTRSTSTADQNITIDFSADELINGFVLGRHNLTSSATIAWKLYSGAGGTGTLLLQSSGGCLGGSLGDGELVSFPAGWGSFPWSSIPWGGSFTSISSSLPTRLTFSTWFNATSCRSIVITISDATNPDGFFEVGRIFTGLYISPMINAEFGLQLTHKETTKQVRLIGGTLRSHAKDQFRKLNFNFAWLNEAEREALNYQMSRIGLRRDIFISIYPEECSQKNNDYAMIAKLTKEPSFISKVVKRFGHQVEVEET